MSISKIDVIQFQDSTGALVKAYAAPFKIRTGTGLTATPLGGNVIVLAAVGGPTGSPYVATFNAIADWSGPSGGYYSITFTHGLGSYSLLVELWDTGAAPTKVLADHMILPSIDTLTIYVSQTPDKRFAGTIIASLGVGAVDGGAP